MKQIFIYFVYVVCFNNGKLTFIGYFPFDDVHLFSIEYVLNTLKRERKN